MASYDDINVVANDSGFQNRCLYALTVVAASVVQESPAITSHQLRVDFARKILLGAPSIISGLNLARAILTINSVLTNLSATTTPDFGITDSQIQTAVTNAYNALAGVST